MKFQQLMKSLNLSLVLFVKTKSRAKMKSGRMHAPVILVPERLRGKTKGHRGRPSTQAIGIKPQILRRVPT